MLIASGVAVLDLSWVMYRYRHALSMCSRLDSNGNQIPTGHVVGTYSLLSKLCTQYKSVILAVDSFRNHFTSICSTYKKGRRPPTGDSFQDYSIHQDTSELLELLCSFQNIFYIKESGDPNHPNPILHDGLEADHIIQSFIHSPKFQDGNLFGYFGDYDCLVPGKFHWMRDVSSQESDVRGVLLNNDKYQLDFSYVPLIFHIIRGQSSDNYPAVIPRLPGKILRNICDIAQEETNLSKLRETTVNYGKALGSHGGVWSKHLVSIGDDKSDTWKQFQVNHELACPIYVPIEDFVYRYNRPSLERLHELQSKFGIT